MGPDTQVLLIDDDQLDVKAVRRAFEAAQVRSHLAVSNSAATSLEELRQGRISPQLILLDLNMPGISGIDFLREIKKDPELKPIPVVMLTTSTELKDRRASFESGAAGYLVKSHDYDEFVRTIGVLRDYWTTSQLPS